MDGTTALAVGIQAQAGMVIFSGLFLKLIPLYVLIILGFHAAKYLAVKKESAAALLIYIITPVVVFQSVAAAPVSKATFLLPLAFFFMATLAAAVFYFLAYISTNIFTRIVNKYP